MPAPTLPPNVYLFTPTHTSTTTTILTSTLFTRLSASRSSTPAQLTAALHSIPDTFALVHSNAVLIFDSGDDEAAVQDAHHLHFRDVCLALQAADVGLDVAKCVHDAEDALGAGFQLDRVNEGAVLVIDLMPAEDEDSSEEESEAEGGV